MLTGDVVGVMAEALGAELARTKDPALSFAERFGLIVEQQWTTREASRLARRLKNAALKLPAAIEEIDFRTPRGLDREVLIDLAAHSAEAGCSCIPSSS